MRWLRFVVAACMTAGLAMVLRAEPGPATVPPGAPGQGGGGGAVQQGGLIGWTLTPATPDGRGWGWQVKASARHFDYVWFELQHSTKSYDEVRRISWRAPASAPHR